jgi:hypothetical protein
MLVIMLIATTMLAATAVVAARIGDARPILQPLLATVIIAAAGATRMFVR